MTRARMLLVGGMLAVLLPGCAAPLPPEAAPLPPEVVHIPDGREVALVDGVLVLDADGERRPLLALDAVPGEVVHAVLRPGGHDEDTVLLLTRVDDELGDRFELRYVVATADAVSESYGFPWRLQIAEELSAILDVAPLPVWAPDGSAIAWIEWVDAGTRLRTVGWIDDGETRNPSDDAMAYALTDVPAGVQLEAWQTGGTGEPELLARQHDQPYRIHLTLAAG